MCPSGDIKCNSQKESEFTFIQEETRLLQIMLFLVPDGWKRETANKFAITILRGDKRECWCSVHCLYLLPPSGQKLVITGLMMHFATG